MISDDLIARAENGSGPDRELDARISAAIEGRALRESVNWQNRPVLLGKSSMPPHDECVMCWLDLREAPPHVLPLGHSFDACLALFEQRLRGWAWLKKSPGVITVYQPADGGWARHFDGSASSDNRAFLVAILRAINASTAGSEAVEGPELTGATRREAPVDEALEQCAALASLAKSGIRPDIQELLIRGNQMQSVPPGALWRAVEAFNAASGPQSIALVDGIEWAGPADRKDAVKAPAPASLVAIPREPSEGVLMSIAIRLDHGLGVPGFYDQELFAASGVTHARRLQVAIDDARRAYEEVAGSGFYRPDLEDWYRARMGDSA